MKDKFVQFVIESMRPTLAPEQIRQLEAVMNNALATFPVKCSPGGREEDEKDNLKVLESFLSAKKVEGCSPRTIAYYRASISKLLKSVGCPVRVIETDDIRSFLASIKESGSVGKVTIDNMRRIFSSFFSWLEEEDYILKNPVRRIHKVRTEFFVREVISDESMETLRDSCTELRDLAMIDLLASTGIRVGELVRMDRKDIDFQERQCVVFGKGDKERLVYFNARTKIHLMKYLASRGDSNPALFVTLTAPYNRLTITGVEARLRSLGRRADMERIHPHKFRRTLATRAIDKGMPIEQVQKLLGHVKIDTTLMYAMVNQNNVRNSHRKYIE